jgi:hypothetical protein
MSTAKQDSAASEDGSKSPASDLEAVKEEYDQLCRELNMDETTMESAWRSYTAIRHNYTLEVSRKSNSSS